MTQNIRKLAEEILALGDKNGKSRGLMMDKAMELVDAILTQEQASALVDREVKGWRDCIIRAWENHEKSVPTYAAYVVARALILTPAEATTEQAEDMELLAENAKYEELLKKYMVTQQSDLELIRELAAAAQEEAGDGSRDDYDRYLVLLALAEKANRRLAESQLNGGEDVPL